MFLLTLFTVYNVIIMFYACHQPLNFFSTTRDNVCFNLVISVLRSEATDFVFEKKYLIIYVEQIGRAHV